MRTIKVKRVARKPSYTIGRIYCDGSRFCDSIEDQDRGLDDSMTLEQIQKVKVYGETAIPTGTYRIILGDSPKFRNRAWFKKYGVVPRVQDVKGFDGVLIHPFNTAEESLGCIGPGENKVVGKVINSTKAYYRLMDEFFIPAWKAGDQIQLVVE